MWVLSISISHHDNDYLAAIHYSAAIHDGTLYISNSVVNLPGACPVLVNVIPEECITGATVKSNKGLT